MADEKWAPESDTWRGCSQIPEFDRLHYFFGQMLGPRDFQMEQDFFRNKQKMLNRCLHGHGVAWGLKVVSVEEAEATKAAEAQQSAQTQSRSQAPGATASTVDPDVFPPFFLDIECGVALDPAGNELVIRERRPWCMPPLLPRFLDVWQILSQQESAETLKKFYDSGGPIYISLYYQEQKHAPQRVQQPCDTWCANYETYARLRDSVCVKIDLYEPGSDDRCGPCCEPFEDPRVLLARIDNPCKPNEREIHNEVRRPLGLYVPTTITGINWQHGATYPKHELDNGKEDAFIRTTGMKIRFSRPVRVGTIKRGVIGVWRSNDWATQDASGDIERLPVTVKPMKGETTNEVVFTVHEDLGTDDGVLIIVRTDFILDECCRPVDGNHVGGLVPVIPDDDDTFPKPYNTEEAPEPGDRCLLSNGLYGPWHSGNGTPGGTFESWFFTTRG